MRVGVWTNRESSPSTSTGRSGRGPHSWTTPPPRSPACREALCRFRADGYRLVIFTSRLSPSWLAESGHTAREQRDFIAWYMAEYDLPYDEITAEKVRARYYIDDCAVHFGGDWGKTAEGIA